MKKAATKKPRKRAVKRAPVRVLDTEIVEPESASSMMMREFGHLSASQAARAMALADQGQPRALVDMFHELRQKSGHLQSVMTTRETAVSGLEWDISAPPDADDKLKEQADQTRKAIASIAGVQAMFEHLVGESTVFGFASTELFWKRDRETLLLKPTRADNVQCRRFFWAQDDLSLLFGDYPPEGTDLLADYTAGKFLVHRRRINGDVAPREGLCRILVWLALFEYVGLGDWLKLAELAWKPRRKGTYTRQSTKEDREILKKAMRRILGDGWSILPETTSIDLLWPQTGNVSSSGTHKELADWVNLATSKAVLGQTDAIEPGKNGARSATEVRDRIRRAWTKADADALDETLTRQLVAPFTRYNFGHELFSFSFSTRDQVDLGVFSEAVAKLVGAGMPIQESYVRDTAGIPEPKDGDQFIEPQRSPEPEQGSDGDGDQGEQDTDEEDSEA